MNKQRWMLHLACAVVTLPCFAGSSIWDGTWKLNVSKSTMPGPSFVMSITSNGQYHFTGVHTNFTFGCDQREYSMASDGTVSCTRNGPFAIDLTHTENGKVVGTAHWELSSDDRTLTITSRNLRRGGAFKPHVTVLTRTTASTGFAGGWRDTKQLESTPSLVLRLNNRTLHVAFEDGQYFEVILDGSDAVIHGPKVPQGATIAMRPNGARELVTMKKFEGRITSRGSLTISEDGRTLTEQFWNPSKPNQKAVLVYQKQ